MGMIGIALLAALGGQVPAEPPLAPSGKWVVEYADNMCVLSHDFGEGDRRATLGFRPAPMGSTMEIVLLTKDTRRDVLQGKASISLSPSSIRLPGTFFSWHPKDQPNRIATVNIALNDVAGLADAGVISITIGSDPPVRVAPKGMTAAFAALKTCDDDLLKTWGIDPHEQDLIAQPAVAAYEGAWLTPDDYPADAINSVRGGTTIMMWTVGIDGKVHDCRIAVSSGTDILDKAACSAITRKGRYRPALDRAGQPMPSHKTRTVKWVLPG